MLQRTYAEAEDLLAVIKSICPKDKTLAITTMGKQKTTNIIRQLLRFQFLKNTVHILRDTKFSIIIDETTDVSTKSQLAIIGSLFDDTKHEVHSVLIDLLEISDGRAVTISDSIVASLTEKKIPMKNVIAFCADTCNVMFGQHHSVATILKER